MRYLALLLGLLLLAGCATDPYTQLAAAEGAINATSIARQVQAQETRGAMNAAALEATRYAGELLAVQAQVQGTEAAVQFEQTAIAVQETRSAADLQATAYRATSQIVEMQATQAYVVQYANNMSTATAIINERELQATARAAEYRRARSWRNLGLAFGWGLFTFLAFMGGTLVYALIINAKARAVEKLAHAQYLYGRTIDQQVATPQLPAGKADDTDNTGTVQFLWDCAAAVGSLSSTIPSHRTLNISSRPWRREVKRLVKAGAVMVEPNKGSKIKYPYHNIDRLYSAITGGSLVLPPYPTEEEYQYLFGTETETETEEYYA